MGAFTAHHAEATSYLSDDPRACVNCHVMREPYDGWQKASHHAVAVCNDCHVPSDLLGRYLTKAVHGYRHSRRFTFMDFHEPIQATAGSRAIVRQNCVRCHAALVAPLRAGHAGGEDDVDCLRCHVRVGHGPER